MASAAVGARLCPTGGMGSGSQGTPEVLRTPPCCCRSAHGEGGLFSPWTEDLLCAHTSPQGCGPSQLLPRAWHPWALLLAAA